MDSRRSGGAQRGAVHGDGVGHGRRRGRGELRDDAGVGRGHGAGGHVPGGAVGEPGGPEHGGGDHAAGGGAGAGARGGQGGLDVVRHGVGLRPAREGGVRLESERVDGVWVVHNYGHAGWGYQGSYGCAERVVELVDEILGRPRL